MESPHFESTARVGAACAAIRLDQACGHSGHRDPHASRRVSQTLAGTIEIDGVFNARTDSAGLAVTGGIGDYARNRHLQSQ